MKLFSFFTNPRTFKHALKIPHQFSKTEEKINTLKKKKKKEMKREKKQHLGSCSSTHLHSCVF